MSISYNRLWKMLIDKNMTKTDLRLKADIATSTLAKLSKNEQVSMDVLVKICKTLDCGLDDVVELKRRKNNELHWFEIFSFKIFRRIY